MWFKHFKSLSIDEEKREYSLQNEVNKFDISEINSSIKWEEILFALKICGNKKAVGTDKIPTEVYKILSRDHLCKKNLSQGLLDLFNEFWEKENISSQ